MRFQITSAGFAAAFAASNQGPLIRINQFIVGSGSGYEPMAFDSALRGTLLYTGTPVGYRVIDPNTCEFSLRIDETQGTWQFGEIGLKLVDGTLFALGTLQRPQWKVAYPDADFNRYNVKIRLVLNGAIPKIEFVVENIVAGIIQELPSIDDLPVVAESETNAYLCHSRDPLDNETLATLGSNRWTLTNYLSRRDVGTVVAMNTNRLGMTVAIPRSLATASPGQYAVQFLSGASIGAVRRVTAVAGGNNISWATPESNAVSGDLFELLVAEGTGGTGGGEDDAFFFSLIGR
jgi:hypothetical protein